MDRAEIARRLKDLAAAGEEEKCLSCHCFVDVLRQVVEDLASAKLHDTPECSALDDLLGKAHRAASHGCLGCDPCLPVEPFNALTSLLGGGENPDSGNSCPSPEEYSSTTECGCPGSIPWPPLPGEYRVLDPGGSVAICTLGDRDLYDALSESPPEAAAIVGMLATENLGIERLVRNVLANPFIRSLVLCGRDSRGHWAGACLAALAERGVDREMRIPGAPGIRPRLVNLMPEHVDAFRKQVRIISRIGKRHPDAVANLVGKITTEEPGIDVQCSPNPNPFPAERVPSAPDSPGDPAGYFVLYADHRSGMIRMEHYDNENRLEGVYEGKRSRDLYLTAVRRGMLSRLDHAAYLGFELGRAEEALRIGARYIQDAKEDP